MTLRDYLVEGLVTNGGGCRTYDMHVLVSEERKSGRLYPYWGGKVKVWMRDVVVLLSEEGKMTCGIEAAVYRIPEKEKGMVYISKVDSTGHGTRPSVTSLMVRRFVSYFGRKNEFMGGGGIREVWVHVFARAQGEYLFLGSQGWKGKRVLNGSELCGWWKKCLGGVEGEGVKRWYLIAGMNEGEREVGWEYGFKEEEGHLGRLVPSFEDDPKSRFLDELEVNGEIGRINLEEFWERMGFRQECIGSLTAFYTLLFSKEEEEEEEEEEEILQGQVGEKMIQRILDLLKTGGLDFSTIEKATRATHIIQTTIQRLCSLQYLFIYASVITTSTSTTTTTTTTTTPLPTHVTTLVPRRKIRLPS